MHRLLLRHRGACVAAGHSSTLASSGTVRCTRRRHASIEVGRVEDLARTAARNIVCQSILGLPRGVHGHGAVPGCAASMVIVVHDPEPCPVAAALLKGYCTAWGQSESATAPAHSLPFCPGTFLDDVAAIVEEQRRIDAAATDVVVVLIQNGAFQNMMQTYRLRLQLWKFGYKVVEHVHLELLTTPLEGHPHMAIAADGAPAEPTENIVRRYLAACTLCPHETHAEALALGAVLDKATDGIHVHTTGGHTLSYDGALEPCLSNTGWNASSSPSDDDDTSMAATKATNVGGSYPFGEVISESRRLSAVSGTASLFAFPNSRRRLQVVPPTDTFQMTVDAGAIVDLSENTPEEFKRTVALVREVDGVALLRELGIGLNPYAGRGELLADITAFERQRGVHVSLGKRHPLFVKPSNAVDAVAKKQWPSAEVDVAKPYDFLRRKDGRFHLDLFLDATHITDRSSGKELVRFG